MAFPRRPGRSFDEYPEYVSSAERQARAKLWRHDLEREGLALAPIRIEGRAIAQTFWGNAWNAQLEQLADLASRLPRGRTYVRSGAILHLALSRGAVHARVAGTDLYTVEIAVEFLAEQIIHSRHMFARVRPVGTRAFRVQFIAFSRKQR